MIYHLTLASLFYGILVFIPVSLVTTESKQTVQNQADLQQLTVNKYSQQFVETSVFSAEKKIL